MQAIATRTAQRAAVAKKATGVVRCQASLKPEQLRKAAAFVATLPAMVAASPAFALVDDRLNGDGVGLALGVNDPVLAWQMAGVVLVLWALYYAAQKDFGNFEDPDSGLDL
eukprot:jgi/Chrzof1/6676/Cz19g05110.t1_PSBW[v5.2]